MAGKAGTSPSVRYSPTKRTRQRVADLAAEMNDIARLLAAELDRLGEHTQSERVEAMRLGLLAPLERTLG